MEADFSTRQVASLLKLPEHLVRLYAQQEAVGVRSGARYRYGFQDLAVLRSCRELASHGFPHARLARCLANLRRKLEGQPALSALAFSCQGDRLIARHGAQRWDAESGQREIPFAPAPRPEGVVLEAAPPPPQAPPATVIQLEETNDAQAWFETAIDIEDADPVQAYQAYLRALACDPEHAEAMINLGRLCAASGNRDRAAAYFRQAIRVAPSLPVAHFNLGVTLHDLGDTLSAIKAYRTALIHDPHFADAHYNLATLLEQQGDRQGALQHMAAYRVAQEGKPHPPRR